jgi:hypothetical protein
VASSSPAAASSTSAFKEMKTPKNAGKMWTSQDVQQLRKLAQQNTPTRIMALKLQRTVPGVQAKAGDKNISLKPTNQSPYNRQKPR